MAQSRSSHDSSEDLLRRAFDAYNRRDAGSLLAIVSDDVRWATDRTTLHGKRELGAYWDHQWQLFRTHDQVIHVEHVSDGRYLVELEQVVRSVDGNPVSTGRFRYEFLLKDQHIDQLTSIIALPTRPGPTPVDWS